MKEFLGHDFLLDSEAAKELYYGYAEKMPIYVKWFANGAATKKMYLTVSHLPDRKLNFSYHYQTVELTENDCEKMYYYMMRILFRGIEDPGRTISEIIDMV